MWGLCNYHLASPFSGSGPAVIQLLDEGRWRTSCPTESSKAFLSKSRLIDGYFSAGEKKETNQNVAIALFRNCTFLGRFERGLSDNVNLARVNFEKLGNKRIIYVGLLNERPLLGAAIEDVAI